MPQILYEVRKIIEEANFQIEIGSKIKIVYDDEYVLDILNNIYVFKEYKFARYFKKTRDKKHHN